jgi:hypothetical protein
MNNRFTPTRSRGCKLSLLLSIVQSWCYAAKCVANAQISANFPFTDEAGFTGNVIVNFHNTVKSEKREETAVARQLFDKHISAATDKHATIEELWKAAYCIRSDQRLHNEDQLPSFVIFASQLPDGKDMSKEAEESALLRATRQRLVKTRNTLCVLKYRKLYSVQIREIVINICSYEL